MKKYSVILLAAIALLSTDAFSQKTKTVAKAKTTAKPGVAQRSIPAVKQPPIKDTLAYYIQTTLNELNANIRDNSQPVQSMLGAFLGSDYSGNSYASVIKVPTSVENTFLRKGVDWYQGVEEWEWKSILKRSPKGQLPADTFILFKSKIDSIIKSMPFIMESDEKNKISTISVHENAQYRYLYNVDEVTLFVEFVKPITQTEKQSIDSLVNIYRPGLSNVSTATDASYKFTSALFNEGFSREKLEMIFADELKVVADKDIKAAFLMLMDASYLKSNNLETKLTEDQRSEIIKIAHNVVNEYNAKWNPVIPPSTNQGTGSSSYWNQQQTQQPQGRTVRCSVCDGVGQYEKVTYSHTYDGIYNKVTTNVTKWVVCEFCGGTGWVVKYKNKKH